MTTENSESTDRQRNANARAWFESQQQKMIAELREVRAVHDHPTAKGDGTELHWLELLQSRLPARYRAERAFVVDADGNRSEQIDIVIHDRQFCPVLLDTAGGQHIPAESVYAVLEVKQDLTKNQILYAGEKIRSVRRLHRTSAEFPHASGRNRTSPKPILGGILTFESGWSPPLGESFEAVLQSQSPHERIDLGCALCDGAFEVVYDADGVPQLTRSAADSSLIFFFLRLLHRLQQVATVPAIDYLDYSRLLVVGDDQAAEAARLASAR
jgi:hypothetical protein